MKKLYHRIIIFLFSYIALCTILNSFTPYHWGNPWYSTKIRYLETFDKTNLPDTYFFGSSRVFRQISPFVFDSTFNSIAKRKIKSFNLGSQATYSPQLYYLYERFLESRFSDQTKYAFIELTDLDRIGEYLKHRERTTYWQNLSDLKFVLFSVLKNSEFSLGAKYMYARNYVASYIEGLFKLGHYGQHLINNPYDVLFLGSEKDGFLPLEKELNSTTNESTKKNLLTRKSELSNAPSELVLRARKSILDAQNNGGYTDHEHLSRLFEIIEKSKAKNIHVVFHLTPRNSSQNTRNIFLRIPQKHRLDLSNAQEYPELYTTENSFDLGHLNAKGAEIYSIFLAEKFSRLI